MLTRIAVLVKREVEFIIVLVLFWLLELAFLCSAGGNSAAVIGLMPLIIIDFLASMAWVLSIVKTLSESFHGLCFQCLDQQFCACLKSLPSVKESSISHLSQGLLFLLSCGAVSVLW